MATKTKEIRYEMRIVKVGCVMESGNDTKVTHPQDILPYIDTIKNQMQEYFLAVSLDGGGNIITSRVITIGLVNHSLVAPRETFRGAILDNAASIIVAHNHPSGGLDPSSQDITITTQLKEAGAIIGIQVLDHIIVTKNGYTSLKERGLM
jgi:DNA repair protein RadC